MGVYNIEALAMLGVLKMTIASHMTQLMPEIYICLNRPSFVHNTSLNAKKSSEKAFNKFINVV